MLVSSQPDSQPFELDPFEWLENLRFLTKIAAQHIIRIRTAAPTTPPIVSDPIDDSSDRGDVTIGSSVNIEYASASVRKLMQLVVVT